MLNSLKNFLGFTVQVNTKNAEGKNIGIENTNLKTYDSGKAEIYKMWLEHEIGGPKKAHALKINNSYFNLNESIICWKKDTGGKLTYISKAYESMFLKPINKTIEDYLGLDDIQFWGKEIGTVYRANDARAYLSKDIWCGVVPIARVPNGDKLNFFILKWKEFDKEENFCGFAGIALPESNIPNEVEIIR